LGVVVAVAVLGGVAWYLLGGDGPLSETADFSFEFGKVGGSPVAEKASDPELQEAANQVRETLDALYVVGFVDSGKWQGGTFPELYEAFAEDMESRVRKDLPNLSLGDDAPLIDTVDPISGRLSIRFLVNEETELIAATARTIFAANAVAKDGGNVAIQHDGTYFLQPADDGWLIRGYDVEGIVTRVTQPLPDPDAADTADAS
jgi:hypothetical protein